MTLLKFWIVFHLILGVLVWFKIKQSPLPGKYQEIAEKRKLYCKIMLGIVLFTAPTFAGYTEWNLPLPWPFHHIGSIGGLAIVIPAALLKYFFLDYMTNEKYKTPIMKYFAACFLFVFFGPILIGGGKALWTLLL